MRNTVLVVCTISIMIIGVSCNVPEKRSEGESVELKVAEKKVTKRIGMVIKIHEDQIEEYKRIHSPGNPGVRDLLTKYNMSNFSIFLQKLDDGNYYEFGYYEYVGNDFEGDMTKLAKEPRNIEWLKVCDPMQIPLEGYDGWAEMKQVYFNP